MRLMRSILLHSFGWPQGILGRLGGVIMARMNADCGTWVTDLLEVRPNDKVLEVGFGPGVVIQRLARLAYAGHVAGIDRSREMVGQARTRSATAVQEGRVELRHGSVESLPLTTTDSTRRWRSTRCSTGCKPSPGCENYSG
jgi:SAM-dependent methyltransferase